MQATDITNKNTLVNYAIPYDIISQGRGLFVHEKE